MDALHNSLQRAGACRPPCTLFPREAEAAAVQPFRESPPSPPSQVEKASRSGVAIWFPMGDANLRVLRLASRESSLLNSRWGWAAVFAMRSGAVQRAVDSKGRARPAVVLLWGTPRSGGPACSNPSHAAGLGWPCHGEVPSLNAVLRCTPARRVDIWAGRQPLVAVSRADRLARVVQGEGPLHTACGGAG